MKNKGRVGQENSDNLIDGKYSIQDLVNLAQLRNIFEKFSQSSGFTVGLLDHPGLNILIATDWRDICTKFHRACPASIENCKKGNIHLLEQLKELGQIVIEECDNGLVDCATPIIIKGKHIASLATGQLFLKQPDIERFRRQARMFGYDEGSYLEALKDIPVVSEEKLKSVTSFLGEIAVLISELGYTNLSLKGEAALLDEEIAERKQAEAVLRESEERFRQVAESAGEWIWEVDANGLFTYSSPAVQNILGFKPEEIIGKMHFYDFFSSDVKEELKKSSFEIFAKEKSFRNFVNPNVHKNGNLVLLETSGLPIIDDKGNLKGYRGVDTDTTEREKCERSLRLLKDAVEHLPIGITFSDLKGTILYTNPAEAEMHGYTIKELIGQKANIFAPEHLRNSKSVEDLSETGIWKHETINIRKTGEIFPVQLTSLIVKDANESPFGIVISCEDITERKRAEEEQRLNESRISSLLQLSQMTIQPVQALTEFSLEKAIELTRSTIGYLAFLNEDETVLTMYSWSMQAMEECMIQEKPLVYPVETTGLWGEAVRQRKAVITNDYQAPNPLRKGYPEGHVHVSRHMNIPLFDGDKIVIVAGVGNKADPYDESDIRQLTLLMDGMWKIIKRKQTEDALRYSEEKYHTVMDNASDAILLADIYGKLLEVNNKAEELLGYTKDELMTMDYSMIHPPEELERTAEAFKEIILKGFTYLRDGIVLRKDGKTVPVDITGSLMAYGGELVVQGIFRDIAERRHAEQEKKKIEEQLFQAQKMEAVGQLAGGIAHDFNNILTAIISSGQLLKMKMDKKNPLKHYVGYILDASERGAILVKGLLAFSRKDTFYPSAVNLNEIIKEIEPLIRRLVPEDIDIQETLTDSVLAVMADKTQIERILINLVANARDAMPSGGLIGITTERAQLDENFVKIYPDFKRGEYAVATVSDTGTGMDEKTREKIFEPFFTTKEVGKGTGLGLSSAYGIIKQHNGSIHVYSKPAIGTTMKIYLPLIPVGAEGTEAEEAILPRGGDETILFAEDDFTVRDVTKNLLQEFGYTVIVAADGKEAVSMFMENKDKIRLVLLDVIMPNLNGKEAYEKMKKINPDIKTIFMSGYTADILKTRFILEDGLYYISKPAPPVHLLTLMRNILDAETYR